MPSTSSGSRTSPGDDGAYLRPGHPGSSSPANVLAALFVAEGAGVVIIDRDEAGLGAQALEQGYKQRQWCKTSHIQNGAVTAHKLADMAVTASRRRAS